MSRTTATNRHAKDRRGQALVMVTMGIVFILGVLGLVVDVGWGYYLKQTAQAAADAAALASATDATANGGHCGSSVKCQKNYNCPTNPGSGDNFAVACEYAAANGYSPTGGQTVTVDGGTGIPQTMTGFTAPYWVTVTVSRPQNLGFLAALGMTGGNVSAQATAAVINGGSGGGCIFVLDPSQAGALTITGTSTMQSSCGIFVNSSSSSALTAVGNSITNSTVIDVVGGTSINNNAIVNPNPTTNQSPASDPLASLPAPSFSGCDYNFYSSSGGTLNLTPGVYCGGIRITGQANLSMAPGVYIMNGGGFTSTSNNTTINANGVMIYNTSSGYTFGAITLAGGTTVTMTAPTSGTYQGILMFQDRTINSSAKNTVTGGAFGTMSGSVYMPTAALSYNGTSTTAQTLALVAKTLTVVGNAYLKKDTTGSLTGMTATAPALVQ